MTEIRTGGCSCGAVRYRIEGPVRPVVGCHCHQCRRQSGHYFAATAADRSDVTIEGEEAITWYPSSPEAKRGFCSRCGSALFWDWPGRGRLSILAGSVDEPTGLQFIGHIFVAEKGDYYEITDGLPQRDYGPNGDVVEDLISELRQKSEDVQ